MEDAARSLGAIPCRARRYFDPRILRWSLGGRLFTGRPAPISQTMQERVLLYAGRVVFGMGRRKVGGPPVQTPGQWAVRSTAARAATVTEPRRLRLTEAG